MYSVEALIFDFIILGIIILVALMSAKRGFVRTVVEVIGCMLALVISMYASKSIASFCYDKFFASSVENSVNDALGEVTLDSAQAIWDALPDYLKNHADLFGINKSKFDDVANKVSSDKKAEVTDEIADNTVKPLVVKALSGIISAVMFSVLFFLIKILSKLINGAFNFSVVGSVNKILGGILGIVKGLIFAVIICFVINFIVVAANKNIWILSKDLTDKSVFFKLFQNLIK